MARNSEYEVSGIREKGALEDFECVRVLLFVFG